MELVNKKNAMEKLEKEEKGKGTFKEPPTAMEILRENVFIALIKKKTSDATEMIVEEIMRRNYIYTTRDDEKAEMWIYQEGIYVPQAKTFIKEFCRDVLGNGYSTYFGNAVITKIEVDTYINADEFFNNTNIDEIAVENGILNILTGKLGKFDPNKIFFNKIPIQYNKDAICPIILKHFSEVLKNQEDVFIMLELFGFLLLKEYRFEKAFMFIGGGRNGKSKTLELMKRFIGIDNCSGVPLQQFETDQWAMGELFNKMVNLAGDLDKKGLNNSGAFKTLTGRDLISAQRKFLTRIKFQNYAKLVFSANDIPRTNDVSFAFFNRWILIEFPFTFLTDPEFIELTKEEKDSGLFKIQDSEIIKKIATDEEMSGLLNMALESLKNLIKAKGFSYSKSTQSVKDVWIRKSDSFNAFLLDCIDEDFESVVSKKVLRESYAKYCKKYKLKASSDKIIKDTLAVNLGVVDERITSAGKTEFVWSGIKIREKNLLGW